jgi:hypothetical protein
MTLGALGSLYAVSVSASLVFHGGKCGEAPGVLSRPILLCLYATQETALRRDCEAIAEVEMGTSGRSTYVQVRAYFHQRLWS